MNVAACHTPLRLCRQEPPMLCQRQQRAHSSLCAQSANAATNQHAQHTPKHPDTTTLVSLPDIARCGSGFPTNK
eukprot:2909917-Prymnesium_polylepis.2